MTSLDANAACGTTWIYDRAHRKWVIVDLGEESLAPASASWLESMARPASVLPAPLPLSEHGANEASGDTITKHTSTGTVTAQSGQTSIVQEDSAIKHTKRSAQAMLHLASLAGRTPPLDFDAAHRRFRTELGLDKVCLCCQGSSGDRDLRLESSRTAFSWSDKTKPDPNAPIRLCRPCAKQHHLEMDQAWQEYQANCL